MVKVLIVGGVAGGATAAARLRRLDESAEIIMFERGKYISFANCGLPYYIGGIIRERGDLLLQTPDNFRSRFNIDVRVQNEVLSINPEKKTVSVRDLGSGVYYEESYDKLILSPGANPAVPPIAGTDSPRVFTLRSIADADAIKSFLKNSRPKSAAVIGGGYIGLETAENLHKAGLKVTIVELSDHVMDMLDYEMACDVHRHIEKNGVRLILNSGVKAINDLGNSLEIATGSGTLSADMAVLAVGVRPESRLAKEAGLKMSENGLIQVNSNMQTSDPDIYAVGDAVEAADFVTGAKIFAPFAGPANKQGRIAADNICGINSRYEGTRGSAILKCFDMTIACTGINERWAKALGFDYEKSFIYSTSHASYYPNAESMLIKLIFEKHSGRILGAQITGSDGVDKRCDVLATAIRANMTVFDLTKLELCYAPPYSSAKDPVNMAGYVAENILTGKVKVFHCRDVENIRNANLLDVRSRREYEIGAIDGFVNIPLDELRGRISELDKSKPVYVVCHSGLRSYIACRILSQHGFDCYNLSGGYRLYSSVYGKKSDEKNQDHGSRRKKQKHPVL